MSGFRNLISFKKAYALAMDIFEITKGFPKEENYAIISQIRRSSRSVCANICEAYSRKDYVKYFKAKLSDAECENSETQVWLDFSFSCSYLNNEVYQKLTKENSEIGYLIKFMIKHPEKFI